MNPTPSYINLTPGDPAPWFTQRSTNNPTFTFDTVAGRHVVLCFFGSAANPVSAASLRALQANRQVLDDVQACFFGISIDPDDEARRRVRQSAPGIRFFWDFDRTVSRLYGAVAREAPNEGPMPPIRQFWLILDPALRVQSIVPFAPDGSDGAVVFDQLRRLLEPGRPALAPPTAPVLLLTNVFEKDLCRSLIEAHERQGSEESGFMRDVGGKTALLTDHYHKQRRDCELSDPALLKDTQNRIRRRIVPEIRKAYQFQVTRMERHIIACYSAEDGGHFWAHRDNTTKGTAHRRFAVSLNLNDDFDGGDISFPEYGTQQFRPPVGAAIVFSCSLLHAVSKVTKGNRFAFLPFLYDEAAAKIRETNHHFLAERTGEYKA